jgi:hypothetical protein
MLFGLVRSFGFLGPAPQIQGLLAAERVLVSGPPYRPEVGAAAWLVARRPEATRELVSLAAERYHETLDGTDRPSKLLARLWYRSGRVEEGIREERARLESHSRDGISSMLLGMEWGALDHGIRMDHPSIGRPLRLDRRSRELALPEIPHLGEERGRGFELHVFIVRDGRPIGAFRILAPEQSSRASLPERVVASVPPGAELVLGAFYPAAHSLSTLQVSYRQDFDWQQLAPLYSLMRSSSQSAQQPSRDG